MLAPTPPMGWNSWNTFGVHIDEQLIRDTADAFVSEGLKDAGYQYVCLDDGWEAPRRDASGRLAPDLEKFPGGMKALGTYIHGLGLKFGIYSCAGTHTCQGLPASYGNEELDAATFAEWGVDFLKYDYCYKPAGVDGPALFHRMGQALRASGRPILYSICNWGADEVWKWAAGAGGHMWRTTGDISDSWESFWELGMRQEGLESYAGPNRWNDPDMLIVGMYGQGNVAKEAVCTDTEYRTHFSLWSLLAAPLMIGCDVRAMSETTKQTLLHEEVIAVNQDPLGRQGRCIGGTKATVQVWAKPLVDGSVAVALLNRRDKASRKIPVSWEALALHDRRPCRVRDLWRREDLGVHTGSFTAEVESHGCVLLKLTPQS